jgi:hypothetical protein
VGKAGAWPTGRGSSNGQDRLVDTWAACLVWRCGFYSSRMGLGSWPGEEGQAAWKGSWATGCGPICLPLYNEGWWAPPVAGGTGLARRPLFSVLVLQAAATTGKARHASQSLGPSLPFGPTPHYGLDIRPRPTNQSVVGPARLIKHCDAARSLTSATRDDCALLAHDLNNF